MLTDTKIRKAKPAEKPIKMADGEGLTLVIAPTGKKLWRYRYRFEGREKQLAIGEYPEITLADARDARIAARALLKEGKDPSAEKRKRPAVPDTKTTFESLAREWHDLNKDHWTTTHAYEVMHSLERDVFPKLGTRQITTITAPEVLEALRLIEARPAIETARRVRQRMSAVFVYAIASGLAENDPAAIVEKALKPLKRGRQPALTDLNQAREILRRADETPGKPPTKLALRLLALTALRPGTLITTPWSEMEKIDWNGTPIWHIPAARMKIRLIHKDDPTRDHLVPLSRQAIEVLQALRNLTGRGQYLFPNDRHINKPASENAIGYLLNRAGYHQRHVPHGWRSTFSTIMNERHPSDRFIIDFMLAHSPKDKVESAYNRAAYLERRTELAQIWADLLMEDQMPIEELIAGPRRASPL
ncbi:tyrosine-type recombinase/integrase [Pseudochelatococcus sp. G4_1912]|uniref:tyrosine-type recombinase/integrase n=1 Tax=Pseudochelatococcus sp. G4_1912 TaxID=3114288 RepID=UPI0039C60F93